MTTHKQSDSNNLEIKQSSDKPALNFPCDFTFKIMGKTSIQFEATVLAILKAHFPEITQQQLLSKESSDGNYISISATVYADSKQQLDNTYRALTNSPEVMVAL